jgi:hypothetical protein
MMWVQQGGVSDGAQCPTILLGAPVIQTAVEVGEVNVVLPNRRLALTALDNLGLVYAIEQTKMGKSATQAAKRS